MDLLFGNQKEIEADVPSANGALTVAELMAWARDNLLTQRPELFMKGDTV
jgi:ubiquitin related modifier 1